MLLFAKRMALFCRVPWPRSKISFQRRICNTVLRHQWDSALEEGSINHPCSRALPFFFFLLTSDDIVEPCKGALQRPGKGWRTLSLRWVIHSDDLLRCLRVPWSSSTSKNFHRRRRTHWRSRSDSHRCRTQQVFPPRHRKEDQIRNDQLWT